MSAQSGHSGSQPPDGGPAITPHLEGGGPTFTTEDAATWALTYQPRLMPLAEPTLVRAEFMTAQALEELQPNSSVGAPDTALLCYVELKGHWRLYNYTRGYADFTTVFEVFDAYTGNFLMLGARP